MGARMRGTITGFRQKIPSNSACLLTLVLLCLRRHCQVNSPELAAPPFIQADDDFFHSSRDRVDASLTVAANIVFPLLDNVAVPAGTDRPARGVYRLHRYNSILLFDQRNNLDKRTDEWITICKLSGCYIATSLKCPQCLVARLEIALPTHANSPATELTEVQPIDG